MPQQQKRKKKGHKPAHQNTTAFYHNPHSRKTATILAAPIQHVCRRCQEKLVWRKQYRKYKPRTQPGKCNHCGLKRVTAAYHTLCETCSRTSPQSRAFLNEWNQSAIQDTTNEMGQLESNGNEEFRSGETVGDAKVTTVERSETFQRDTTFETQATVPYRRICAICVKAPALPEDEEGQEEEQVGGRRLRLRERKTLERQQERGAQCKQTRRGKQQIETHTTNADNDESDQEEDSVDSTEQGVSVSDNDDDDSDDPFLNAVGGADKLLIGQEYQQMLLQQEKLKIG